MGNIARVANPVNSAGVLSVANARLHTLRKQRQCNHAATATSADRQPEPTAEQAAIAVSPSLPSHLGWGDHRVPTQPDSTSCKQASPQLTITVLPDDTDSAKISPSQTLTVHPSLLIAFLKNDVAAIGRIWLLARFIDKQGRGYLTIDVLRQGLTDRSSPLRVCGWRRLRQILQAGKGVFWERDEQGRLWLYGTIRVARNLDLARFSADAIALPINDLLGTMGAVQAAFFAAFHCGRDATPISRATLNEVTGVPTRTQRHYDNAQNTARVTNFSLVTDTDDQAATWQHGRAAFAFTDSLGKHGTAGQRYTAVRLPNSYKTTRYARLSGKRKRLNHQLKQGLVNHGTQGNGLGKGQQLFFSDGQKALRAFSQNHDVYLRGQAQGRSVFWTGWMQ